MKYYSQIIIVFSFICAVSSFAQQISTDDALPLEQLIQNNFGQNCVEISNISSSVNGAVNGFSSYGFFDKADSNFPFQNGIVLTTGNVTSAGNIINTSPLNEGDDSWLTDPDLETALNIQDTQNATSIQFDFISVANQIQFKYLLASEEYQQEYPCFYSDGFAFLIREAGTTDSYTNIALIPGTSTPVNTSTIHDLILGNDGCPAENEAFFEGYNVGDTNYNGRTVVLTATAAIEPNVAYEIKLIIADQNDENFDSAVFIEGNSFNASVDLGPDITTCGDSVTLDADIENDQASYAWFQDNVLIEGENNSTLEATSSGNFRVEITIQLDQTSCVIEDSVGIILNTEQSSTQISDYVLCDDPSNDGIESFDLTTKINEALSSVPPSTYDVSFHFSNEEALNDTNPITGNLQNTSSPQPIFIRIEDTTNGCLAYSTFNLVVNEKPPFTEPNPIIVCEDSTLDGFTFVDLNLANEQIVSGNGNLFVTYHYSEPEADLGINPIFSPYANSNTDETIYVRIFDPFTGCFSTTTIEVEITDSPEINQENQWINGCEQDEDGFEDFDLTSVVENVLQGLTNVNVSFHLSLFEANENINPIANPENYQNIIPNFQMVFIRVEDQTTGCFAVTPLELHSNIVQTGFSAESFFQCDDATNDGIANFNLAEIETDLADGYEGFEITFYLTEDDRDANENAINESVPFTVTDNGTTIFATVIDGDCITFVSISLEVAPAIALEPQTADYCDEDADGFTTLIMDSFNQIAAQGVTSVNVKYYNTEADAINNENILPDFVYNSSNPQTFYVRVTNAQTECFDITSLEVNVVSAPSILYPEPIVVCDDDSDGISTVNLASKIPEIIVNSAGFNISFYDNYNFALEGINAIENPDNHETSTQYIYARVENESTECFSLSGFYVYINTLPEFPDITNFENCEADIEGVADFLFYLKDAEILNGQTDKQVLYYETSEDAASGNNPIDKYAPYQNTSSPQVIYVRVESFTDSNCFGTSSFELEVGSIPIFNPAESLFICDDLSNDGIENFDLSETEMAMRAGSPESLDITFHTSEFNARNNIDPLPLDYTNFSNPQQLFARVDNGNYCLGISAFDINIIPAPVANTVNPVERCDSDYDGVLSWDLTVSEVDILDVRQDNIVVSYFESLEDLQTDINPIGDPENYNNISNPQTVYVKVNNTVSNCFVSIPLELVVNLPPAITDFSNVEICDNNTNTFNLDTVNALLVNDPTVVNFSYHTNQNEADLDINPLDNSYTYAATTQTITARIEFIDTGCWITYPFELIVNPLPIANQPFDLETCDDLSNDGVENFNLTSQNASILQNQNPDVFVVSYHNSLLEAENNSSPLPENYSAQHNASIFVRVTNSITNCFATSQFNTIIYTAPALPGDIIICDTDYDGLNTFDLTSVESELFDTLPPNIIFSYFETLYDLETDSNQINAPEVYNNLSNPQTVYLKVFNTSANCFTPLPINISTTLPPPINPFGVYEICDNPAAIFNLSDIESTLVGDSTNTILTYYLTENDAQNGNAPISINYNYTTSNDLIFVRIEEALTGCFYVHNFNLQVNPLPIANQPNAIETCDDESNNGTETFNLSTQTSTILGSQDPDLFTVSYHLTVAAAESNTMPVMSPLVAQNETLITARVENNSTGCFSLTDFLLIVNPHPFIPPPLVVCDSDYDAFTQFDLTMSEEMLFENSNPDHTISYYESLEDLEANLNPIENPENYTNLSNPQTVFIKVFNTVADCFTFVPQDLNVNLPPAINNFEIFDACTNPNSTVDLNTINTALVDTNFNVLINYFSSEEDAFSFQNALDPIYTYSSDSDIIFARIEFSTTQCFYIYPFELRINPLPIANTPPDLEDCDDDFDGFLSFDLSQQSGIILGNQSPNDFSVSYYNDTMLAIEGDESLNPNNYQAADGEIITARVENNATGCFELTSFATKINIKPFVNIPEQVICLDNLPLVVSAETFTSTDNYLWSTGDNSSEIEITETGTYSVTVTSEFGCMTTSTFDVIESESATIDLTETVDFSDPNNITITISGIGNYLYILDDGEPQESNIFQNVALGYHTITIIDLNGCADVTKEVVVVDAPKFFTPNNDSQNDTWHIVGIETLPGSVIYIFDRYGKLLTQLNSESLGWDGNYNGNTMPASDYWFLAEIQQGDVSFDVKGHFALRR